MTSLEGGAGVGSGLGKGYKWPPPSTPLHRGPLEARSARDRPSRGSLTGGGSSERAPGLERSGQGRWAARITRQAAVSLAGDAERGARGAGPQCGVGGSGEQEDKPGRLGQLPAGSAGTRRAGRVALTMVYCWDTGVLLCALLSGLLLTGQARPGSDGEARAHSRGRGHAARRASAGTWDASLTVQAWGRDAFFLRGVVRARASESSWRGPRASPPWMALRLPLGGWSR